MIEGNQWVAGLVPHPQFRAGRFYPRAEPKSHPYFFAWGWAFRYTSFNLSLETLKYTCVEDKEA